MLNELLFIAHVATVSAGALFFARMGKQALTAYITMLFLAANIFVIKQIDLFGFCVTSADAFIVGISFSCNLLQEFWDKQTTRNAIWISFACSLCYMFITQIILWYQPAAVDDMQPHLMIIMSNTVRIILASFAAYLTTQFIDMQLYAIFKQATQGKYFLARNYIALAISQLIDTLLFSFLGLWGIVANMFDIIVVSYSLKIFAIVLATPFLLLAKKVVRHDQINA